MANEYPEIEKALQVLDHEGLVKKMEACQERLKQIESDISALLEERREKTELYNYYSSLQKTYHNAVRLKLIDTEQNQKSDRFKDSTILEATKIILAESKTPLHIDIIVQRLKNGGMSFRTENPTDSVEVTIKRETDMFDRTDPRTYKLK